MQVDLAIGSARALNAVGLEQTASAFQRLSDAVRAVEGAFDRLVDRVDDFVAGALPAASAVPTAVDRPPLEHAGAVLVDEVVSSNQAAADRSLDVWDAFGDDMVDMFARLFQQVAIDGEVSFSSLFATIAPVIAGIVQQISGIDLSGILSGIGGSLGGGAGSGIGIPDILNLGTSILDVVTGGPGGLVTSFATSGLGTSLGLSTAIPTLSPGLSAGGGLAIGGYGAGAGVSAAAGGTGATLTAAGSALAAVAPYLAVAAAPLPIVMGTFGPSPSVGPTTVARVSPVTGDAVYTIDNGGDPDALIDTVEAIFDQIDRFQSRFGGVLNGNGFDIGYFPNPEDGSGQTGGYNFKAIVGAHAEDADRFKGLTEAELITEAVTFIVQEGLDGIDVPEVAEAAKHSVAESLEELFEDLVFAEHFGALRVALDDAGEGIDAYTVALQRQRLEIVETGRTLATDGVTAIRDFLDRVMTLFPGETYLEPASFDAPVDISGIGTPIRGEDRTLLYEQEEGARRFQPGVSGVYDDRDRGLIGLSVGGETLNLANAGYTDEGHYFESDPPGEGSIAVSGGSISISNEALEDLVGTVDDLGDAAEQTTTYSQEYLGNQQRVADAFAIALADVDALVETIAGGFEPETIGPFEERLIAGTAAIGQLETELERINEDVAAATEVFPGLGVAAIDVAEKIQEATDLLTAQLRSDYDEQIERELRDAQGLGAVDGISDLADEFADRRADGEAIGITDFNDLEELYRQKIVTLLEGTDDLAGVLDEVGGSFSDLIETSDLLPGAVEELGRTFSDDLDRDVRETKGLGIIDAVADRLSEYEDRRAVGEALGIDDLSGLDEVLRGGLSEWFDPSVLTPDVIEALQATFADNALVIEALTEALDLNLAAANDNMAAQLSLAEVTNLATQELSEQIREQEHLAGTAERVVESISETRRRIALDSDLSTLSPQEQLNEAKAYFNSLAERAADGDQDAQLELGSAATDYLQLARDFYASSEDYARIFDSVDAVLGDTQSVAEQQLDVAREQLAELREISRTLSGGISDLPNPAADFGRAPTRNRLIARLTGYTGDFGNGGFAAYRGGLSDDLNRVVDQLVQAVPFALGGIMTDHGSVPLGSFADGGIADSPQVAIFGEGRLPEAFVPLPDGRSIPVTLSEPANDRATVPFDGESLAELIEETRRMTAAVNAMRSDNASLRRGLERVVAASRGTGRAA